MQTGTFTFFHLIRQCLYRKHVLQKKVYFSRKHEKKMIFSHHTYFVFKQIHFSLKIRTVIAIKVGRKHNYFRVIRPNFAAEVPLVVILVHFHLNMIAHN